MSEHAANTFEYCEENFHRGVARVMFVVYAAVSFRWWAKA